MRMFVNVNEAPEVEDHFGDVLAKAQVGLQQGKRTLAEEIGVDPEVVRRWHDGVYHSGDESALRAAAELLNLHADALLDLATGRNLPPVHGAPEIAALNTPFGGDMTTNAWAIRGSGIAFDTGTDPGMWAYHEAELAGPLHTLLLTHGHRDHIACLTTLRESYPGLNVYAHPDEGIPGTKPLSPSQELVFGALTVTVRLTPGHSPGGLSFVIDGLSRPVAVCGDALFARSVGGIRRDYPTALKAIRTHLLSLPTETLLLPGHGPATTVGDENAHNPFFA